MCYCTPEIRTMCCGKLDCHPKNSGVDLTKTPRGFDLGKFEDLYGSQCSLQKSSLATEEAIWLGINDVKPQIMASKIIEGGKLSDCIMKQSCQILKEVSMQSKLMKFDPASGEEKPYPSHAEQWRIYHGMDAWLFNPWSGARRHPSDVGSDCYGYAIIADPEKPLTPETN